MINLKSMLMVITMSTLMSVSWPTISHADASQTPSAIIITKNESNINLDQLHQQLIQQAQHAQSRASQQQYQQAANQVYQLETEFNPSLKLTPQHQQQIIKYWRHHHPLPQTGENSLSIILAVIIGIIMSIAGAVTWWHRNHPK